LRYLVDQVGIVEEAAAQIVDYFAAAKAALGLLPTQQDLVFERFFDETDGTLLCGDLFSQPGTDVSPLTESLEAIWQPSEGMRQAFPYAPVRNASDILDGFARLEPGFLACMHGSSFLGEGGILLRKLRDALAVDAAQPGVPPDVPASGPSAIRQGRG
jgi:hypothetical protein